MSATAALLGLHAAYKSASPAVARAAGAGKENR